jgi:hypothetical protein
MTLTNAAETAILQLLFENTDWANIGDATGLQGSTADGVFYISLHTSDPGEAGNQTTNEATYTSYARISVARTTSGWTVSGDTVTNDSAVTFATATGGSSTITHFGIGTDVSGTGNLIMSGTATPNVAVTNGITPLFDAGQLSATAA